MHNYLRAILTWAKVLQHRSKIIPPLDQETSNEFQFPEDIDFCHKDKVHIFVRGLADGKLHSAKNRNYSDVRFYKKQGLKVFCAVCRKKIV